MGHICVGNVVADNLKIPDFYSEPGINKGRAYENGLGNESIDPFSGGLLLQYQDMVLPGNGGMDIVINRTYRSLQGVEPVLEQQQERRVVGIGWDIHFGRVWTAPNTVLCDTTGTVTTGPNLPASNRNPVFESSDGSRKVLVTEFSAATPYHMISKDRWIATCMPAADNPWSNLDGLVVQSPDGTKYTFGIRGRAEIGNQASNLPLLVNSIEDRNGNWLVIDYDLTSSSYALIDRVRSSDGREVQFYYTKGALPEDVRLDRITAFPGTPDERTWRYSYTQAQFTSTAFTSPWYLLTRVQSPESEVAWQYAYYPDDPDGPDAATGKYDAGRFSLHTITLPEGAVIEYQYGAVAFDTRPGAFGDDIDTTVVTQKVQRGDDIENGTWHYDFLPHSSAPGALITDLSFPTLDETRVRGPQYCTTYKHVGIQSINFNAGDFLDDGVWTVGLLLERKTYATPSCSGTVLEKETLHWGKQLISTQNEFRPTRSAIDENTYAAIMLEKTLQRDGTDYVTTFSNYDAYGNPQTIVEQGQDVKTSQFVYAPNIDKWLLKLVERETIEGIGDITRTFDSNGNTLTETKYGVITLYTYHPTGDVATSKNARSYITSFNNYFRGIPQKEQHPQSVTINRVVNPAGTVQSETNGRGKTTEYTYDLLNRTTSIAKPQGDLITVSRPSANETILTRGGFRKREVRDGVGRVTVSVSEDTVTGETIQQTVTYDNIGNKIFESYPNSILGTSTTYDSLGRVLTQSQPDGAVTRFAYLGGNQVDVTDPRLNVTHFFYRAFGTPDQRALMRIESPESVVTTIARNRLDLVTSIQQGGFQRDFAYDSRYFLISETHPEVGIIHYGRDAVGNKTSETYAINTTPKTTTFGYDGLDRLFSVNYAGASPDVVYQFDLNSNVTVLRRGDIRWNYGYDDNDNLISERLTVGAQVFDIGYQYNTLDALSRITYPSGLVVDYAPNRYGWPTQAGSFVTSVDYHPSGQIKTIRYANGVEQTIALNNRLLPSAISAAGIIDLAYAYDPSGNVSSILDGLQPGNNVTLGYDGINRLTTANGVWGAGSFAYDATGNLTSKTIDGQVQTYQYDPASNLLQSLSGALAATLTYDVFGNVTSDGDHGYVYDESSDLIQVAAGNTFRYDGNKRRTVEQQPDTTVYTLYNQAGDLVYEYDVSHIIQKEYVRLGSTLVAIREDLCDARSDDTDGDGMPDCFETKVGLDPNDPLDAEQDPDEDGLTNLEEFQSKTNPFRSDTDYDGIPDGYEVHFGLDPFTNDAAQDPDGDGFTNTEEFLGDSDPLDPTSVPKGSVKWHVDIPGTASFPAIADDGTIYVLATNLGEATLYAVSNSGAILWSRILPGAGDCAVLTGLDPGDLVPGVSDEVRIAGQVAVGRRGIIYASCDGSGTFAFDTAGNALWNYPTGGFIAVTADRVFVSPVTSLDAEIHALNSVMGTRDWTYSVATDAGPFGDSVVADSDGVVYGVTGCDRAGNDLGQNEPITCVADPDIAGQSIDLYAINPDGNLKWVQRDIGNVYGKPSIGIDGSLYLGIKTADGQASINVFNADGSMQRKTKGDIGATDPEVNPPTQPVIDKQGNIYTVALRVRVFRPDLSEKEEWSNDPSNSALNFELHTPTLAEGGRIYRTTSEQLQNKVYSLDSGVLYWATSYVDGPNFSDVSIAPDNTLIAVTAGANSALYSLANNQAISRSVWPMAGGNVQQTRSLEPCDSLDSDGDGLTDCYEQRIGSDPADPADAMLDADGDGLTNLQEAALHTHPYNADTDGDSMPDAYEVAHGLDPRSNSSLKDSDADGAIDSIERLLGTDPTDAASVPAPGGQLWSVDVAAPIESAPVQHSDRNPVFTGVGEVDYLGELVWGLGTRITNVLPMIDARDYIVNASAPPFYPLWLNRLTGTPVGGGRSFGNQIGPGFALASNGAIYFGSTPRNLYRIDGPGTNWNLNFDADVTTVPVINTDGTVIVGTADGMIHAVDDTGAELWSFATADALGSPATAAIAGSPAIGGGDVLYMPAMVTPLSVCDPLAGDPPDCVPVPIGPADGRLFAVAPDGTLIWSLSLSQGVDLSTAPVIGSDGTIYVTSQDGFIYAVDPAGTGKWSYETGGPIRSNPVIGADNNIYFGSDDGFVYSLRADGTLAWRVSVGAPLGAASPYIDDKGVMYVGTSDNRLLGLYVGVRGLAVSPWPTIGHDQHRTGNVATQLVEIDQPPELLITAPADGSSYTEGTLIVLEATATDAEDGNLANAINWSSVQDGELGTGGHLELSGLAVGQHTITATVTDSGGNSVSQTVTLAVSAAQQVVVSLNTSLDSPQITGQAVTLSAVVDGGVGSYEYRFRIKGDATSDAWVVLSDYSPQATFVWDTTAYLGKNRLQVSARAAGSTDTPINSGQTFWVNGIDPADTVTLATDLTSPQEVGQVITLTGTAAGGTGPYEYRFEVRSVTNDGDWQLLQDFSRAASANWDTTGYLGKNRIRVLARKADSLDEPVKQGQAYWVNAPNAATDADLSVTPGGTQPSGTPIQLGAQGIGGSSSYVYEFQLKGPSTGDQWEILQPYSANPTYDWDTTGLLGQYRVRVQLKNAGTDDEPVTRGRNLTLE